MTVASVWSGNPGSAVVRCCGRPRGGCSVLEGGRCRFFRLHAFLLTGRGTSANAIDWRGRCCLCRRPCKYVLLFVSDTVVHRPVLGSGFLATRLCWPVRFAKTCSEAGFEPRMTSESSKCQKRHHSSHLCPLWRFLRQIGWRFSLMFTRYRLGASGGVSGGCYQNPSE